MMRSVTRGRCALAACRACSGWPAGGPCPRSSTSTTRCPTAPPRWPPGRRPPPSTETRKRTKDDAPAPCRGAVDRRERVAGKCGVHQQRRLRPDQLGTRPGADLVLVVLVVEPA